MSKEIIQKLVEKLSTFPYILEVKAISKYLGGKWLDFQIFHNYQTDWDYILPDRIREEIFDLIINANWELRDVTGEKWYFDHEYYYEKFPLQSLVEVNELIATSGVTRCNS